MVEELFFEIAFLVFILVIIGLGLTIYEFKFHVFDKKKRKIIKK